MKRFVELAIKKMFMKESIILSLTDADDFTINFEHVLALANSFDFNFWFHRIAGSAGRKLDLSNGLRLLLIPYREWAHRHKVAA